MRYCKILPINKKNEYFRNWNRSLNQFCYVQNINIYKLFDSFHIHLDKDRVLQVSDLEKMIEDTIMKMILIVLLINISSAKYVLNFMLQIY